MRYLILIILATGAAQAKQIDVAATVAATVATKALSGEFGQLADWQREGYTAILERGTVRRKAFLTYYWCCTETASGQKAEVGRTAAMLEPRRGEFPYGTFVLVESYPNRHELRQVHNTGAWSNARKAREKKCDTWIDLYVPRKLMRSTKAYIYIVRRRTQ